MQNPFEYQFEWDSIKAHQNARKRGVTFECAATVFLDPQALSEFDEEHSQPTLRILLLQIGSRWPEDGRRKWEVIVSRALWQKVEAGQDAGRLEESSS